MMLWSKLADELASWCCTSAAADIKTVSSRVENEGLGFFTITLPDFGKAFERSLDQGQVAPAEFAAFMSSRKGSYAEERSPVGLPVFLRGFLGLVFDPESGRLLENPSIDAIFAIRQLTLVFGKLFLLSNERRERAAMRSYLECEQDVHAFATQFSPELREQFRRVANVVLGRTLRHINRVVSEPWNLLPGHGPGATADGLKGNQKWSSMYWTQRLEKFFPSVEFLLPNASYHEALGDVDFLEPEAEIPVMVLSVPKTQKTPRIIAAEPTAMMYVQQALRHVIYEWVERDNLLNTLIGFTDQSPNQRLACEGSREGSLATLDLSEASDRVSFEHVRELFAFTPDLFQAVSACRSLKAQVPGHGTVSLAKFASMGSALSFPIEAMVFLTIVFIGYENTLNRPLTFNDVKSLKDQVRIFGDDIIIPKDIVRSVISALSAYGMKVNEHKSFWTGKFRESCGKEYYDGLDVSIVKLRQMFPKSRRDVRELIALVSTRNQFYELGLWQTARWLDNVIEAILRDYPVVAPTSPVLGRHSYLGETFGYPYEKVGGRYQHPLVKGYVVRADSPINPIDDHHALRKWFLLRRDLPLADKDHLRRSGRPLVVNIKRGWFRPF
jgi:hypothetical protein